MITKFLQNFKKLPDSNKSMIYLMWIYNTGWIISTVFINIYIFSFNKEIIDVFTYNIIFVVNILVGFSFVGYIMSILSFNIKNMYYFAYIFYILAFLLIFSLDWYLGIYTFAVIFWLWFGMFWCAVHSQELVNIEDKTRDIYSSIIYFWKTIINIVIPLLIALLFFIVELFFSFSAYIVLFLFLPLLYSISFIFIKDIWNYIPKKIKKSDIKNFFNIKKHFFSHLYFLIDWFLSWIYWSVFPVVAIYLLKTEINIWILEGIIWFISTFVIIFVSCKRKIENRVKILWIISFLLFINSTFFVFNFNIIWYLIFILIWIVLNPLYKISEHVFKLKLIDNIKIEWSDFFAPMILREVTLWFGRILILLFLVLLLYNWFTIKEILKIWIFLTGILFIITWISINLHVKYENKIEN